MHANQLVYNAPTLLRLREAAGAVVGANMDPSHLMWMGSDPIQSVRALDGAIYHVHAKDTRLQSHRQALTSRLETLPRERVDDRAWNYVTLGDGHPGGTEFWSQFIAALGASGYTGPLSIEHEDLAFPPVEGVRRSVDLLRAALKAQPAAWSAGRLSPICRRGLAAVRRYSPVLFLAAAHLGLGHPGLDAEEGVSVSPCPAGQRETLT